MTHEPHKSESREERGLHKTVTGKVRRQTCLPGKRLLVLLGVGVFPLLAAPAWPGIVGLVVIFDLFLIAGMLLDYGLLRRNTRLRVTRSREVRLSVGVDNPITLKFEHRGSGNLRLWARDSYPGEFEAAGDDIGSNDVLTRGERFSSSGERGKRLRPALQSSWEQDADLIAQQESDKASQGLRRRLARELTPGGEVGDGLVLQAGSTVEVDYQVTPIRRGDYAFGAVHLRLESSLGLATMAVEVDADDLASVYPNIQGVRQLGLATRFRNLQHLGFKLLRKEGGGREFEKLRDYVPGDEIRDIDWKATARRKKPISRVYEAEKSQNVLLCVDAGRPMAVKSGELSKLDHVINAALLLAHTAIKGGDKVGLVVFADQVKTFLPPARGSAQYRRILQALYGVKAEPFNADYQALMKFLLGRVTRRTLVTLFTEIQADEIHGIAEYTRLLLPRHLPLCISLSDEALEKKRHAIPESLDQTFERVVATEILRDRDILKGELQKQGVHVIDRPANHLTVDTINAYVDLKRRRL